MSSFVVGIDLGTTNSCIGVYKENKVDIIDNEGGHRTTPSWVTYTEDTIYTGPESIDVAHLYVKSTIFEAKRLIGQRFSDPKVQEDIARFPYDVIDDCGIPKIKITLPNGVTKDLYAEEISANILFRMKTIAEARLNTEITKAVITVPAYFNDGQRQATKDAATIAGFETVNVINEPTAAALAFNHQNQTKFKRNIVVYDFGGGTFDVSVVNVENGNCQVKSTKGDCHLGGTDIDMRLVKFIADELQNKHNKTLASDDNTLRRVKNACEKAKMKLSAHASTNIELDAFAGLDFTTITLSRARFNNLNDDIFQKTLEIIDDCLKESKLTKDEIDAVVLVGGSSRIPKIQEMLVACFGKEKINKGVNPDEAVAYGAAIYAMNRAGDHSEVTDVTSLSLGTNSSGDIMSVIIPRNTPIPAKCTKRYQTVMDNQSIMEFPIYQGERDIASENYELGHFTMTDLTAAEAKAVKVEVCYSIDEEGLLHVSANEINSNNNNKNIKIDVKKQGLSEEQIKQRIEEAKKYKEKDLLRIKFNDQKHALETILYEAQKYTEKNVGENSQKILDTHDDICRWLEKAKLDDLDEIIKKQEEIKNLIAAKSDIDN